jgi:hypothetical protein
MAFGVGRMDGLAALSKVESRVFLCSQFCLTIVMAPHGNRDPWVNNAFVEIFNYLGHGVKVRLYDGAYKQYSSIQ